MKTEIAAVVVLYHPTASFINNIYTYLNDVSLLIIVDNSEKADTFLYDPLRADPRIKFIINNENTGMARAINTGIKLASSKNFEWVLTMDQDSYFGKSMISKYVEHLNVMTDKNKIAVAGPVTEKQKEDKDKIMVKPVSSLITSGSLIHVPVFVELGGYNEKLFIDEVDHEYCYRARLSGYSIWQFRDIFLEHTLGKQVPVTTIFGKKKIKTFHPPLRLYYIVRNCHYLISTYKKNFPEEIKLRRKDLLVRIKNNILYGTKRLSALKHIILGFIHYKMNRFGKL